MRSKNNNHQHDNKRELSSSYSPSLIESNANDFYLARWTSELRERTDGCASVAHHVTSTFTSSSHADSRNKAATNKLSRESFGGADGDTSSFFHECCHCRCFTHLVGRQKHLKQLVSLVLVVL